MYLFGFSVFIGPIARNWLFAINLCSHKCRQHSLQPLSIDPSFLAAQLAIKLLEIVKNVFGEVVVVEPKEPIKNSAYAFLSLHLYLYICISLWQRTTRTPVKNPYSPLHSYLLFWGSRADCRNLKCANWLPESCQKLCLKFIYLFFLPVSPCSSFFIPFLCLAMQNKVGKNENIASKRRLCER